MKTKATVTNGVFSDIINPHDNYNLLCWDLHTLVTMQVVHSSHIVVINCIHKHEGGQEIMIMLYKIYTEM